MGFHRESCPRGHSDVIRANSCRHRSCPECAYLRVERWLQGAERRILPCPHYHIIFTIPHELNPLWLANPRAMANLLFMCARATIFEMLEDPRRLAARPGAFAALHTWGGTLPLHPHVHFIVTDGGSRSDGTWIPGRSSGLLPIRAASMLFRGKFLDGVRRAAARGELIMPAEMTAVAWAALLRKLYAKKWNVFIRERYSNSRHVLSYLARYVRGGPIGNRRLIRATNGTVTFRYRSHRAGRKEEMTLHAEEFIRRLLLHVPPRGFQCVRAYGLYANSNRIVPRLPGEEAPVSRQMDGESSPRPKSIRCCPRCGEPLSIRLYPAHPAGGSFSSRDSPMSRLH